MIADEAMNEYPSKRGKVTLVRNYRQCDNHKTTCSQLVAGARSMKTMSAGVYFTSFLLALMLRVISGTKNGFLRTT